MRGSKIATQPAQQPPGKYSNGLANQPTQDVPGLEVPAQPPPRILKDTVQEGKSKLHTLNLPRFAVVTIISSKRQP